MYFKDKSYELTDENIMLLVKAAKEDWGDGIYVPCDYHPCGYDFISFENMEVDVNDEDDTEYSPFNYRLDVDDISDNIYDTCHPFINLTLEEVLKETELKFELEKN